MSKLQDLTHKEYAKITFIKDWCAVSVVFLKTK